MSYFRALRCTATSAAFLAVFVLSGCSEPIDEGEPAEAPIQSGPPSTDIWLFDIHESGISLRTRVTDRDGYDNQPSFSSDGRSLLFTSDRTGTTDIYSYDLISGETERVTSTIEREYSPLEIPGAEGQLLSVVRQDTSDVQELWSYSRDGIGQSRLIAAVDRVAYYTWAGTGRILFWRLGSPGTLQLVDVASADTSVITIGSIYSLQRIQGREASAYLIVHESGTAEIRSFDWQTFETSFLAAPMPGGRDFAWTPDGGILMMADNEMYSISSGGGEGWTLMGNLGLRNGNRLAVRPDGTVLAVVGDH